MKIRTRRVLLALVACVAVGAAGVQVASADNAASTVTIKYTGDGFKGKVKSDKDKCIKDRKVSVFKKGHDNASYKDTSDNQGSWNTGNSGQVNGKWYARVGNDPGCKAAVSDTINAG